VPRWVQLVAVPLLGLAAYAVVHAAGGVLLLFIAAGVIALVLAPVVGLMTRFGLPRGVAIAAVYLGFATILVGAGVLLASPISEQVGALRDDVPSIVDSANARLADVQEYFDDRGINVQITKQGQTALETLQDRVVGGTDEVVSFGTDLLERAVTAGFALVLVLVLSIYMLIHGRRIGDLLRRLMPDGDGSREDDYPTRVVGAVAGYVRGQALFCLAMGTGAGVGLYVFGLLGIFPDGRTYALAFGVFFGLMELVPYVGPFLGAFPPMLVALFQDPLTAVWVGLLFIALQQIEGHIVAPVVFGHALRINPILVIFALLFGGELFGLVGALFALPVAAVLRETFVYLREHLVLESWAEGPPLLFAPTPASAALTCPTCSAPVGAGDGYCRACGAEVVRDEVTSQA
jgi:predicted PurR-regulated permease PerM